MKNIENIVTDLETSKALQEAGINYDTAFVWAEIYRHNRSEKKVKFWLNKKEITPTNYLLDKSLEYVLMMRNSKPRHIMSISTFTAGELMQVLPAMIKKHNIYYHLNFAKIGKHYDIRYSTSTNDKLLILIAENKFIDALAKLMLWCRKEGYL